MFIIKANICFFTKIQNSYNNPLVWMVKWISLWQRFGIRKPPTATVHIEILDLCGRYGVRWVGSRGPPLNWESARGRGLISRPHGNRGPNCWPAPLPAWSPYRWDTGIWFVHLIYNCAVCQSVQSFHYVTNVIIKPVIMQLMSLCIMYCPCHYITHNYVTSHYVKNVIKMQLHLMCQWPRIRAWYGQKF